ncbi:ABC transporter substrate-binding protein [Limobrevibacterium gyesilva]|uniref:ABC transporter substrate-binding protein n=1 Tax=Limobrevibacterium gyesilva TaxID=2991712 RepID=A0AA42CIE5_9PROT|nr:ABC transporter substrate-binding protein [Limobrevibacterium gyesilva]MCW3475805.1 ABC transporter substrate-binding protein [Limobrevibacterium gyesilva]
MQLSRRAALSAALLPLLARPVRAAPTPDRIIFGLSAFPPSLLPFANTGAAAATVKLLMYRGLMSYDRTGTLRGELAESWQPDGATGWLFRLREAGFHNGAPVTSADVRYTLEQVVAERSTAYLRSALAGVKQIDTPDARTVRIVMAEPTATLPEWLASPHMPIIAQGSIEQPIGAGPYTLTAQERGVSLELTASGKFYRPGLPKTKTIRMIAYPDENLRLAALTSGDVDIIEYVPWQSFDAVQASPALKLDSTMGPFMNLLFNGRSGPFKDPRLRLATAFAIRREEIVKAVFFGHGAPLGSLPIAPGSAYYDPNPPNAWHYDPDRARKLLAEAGVPNGFDCTLLATSQYGMHRDTGQIVQQHLGEIGIRVQLSLPEWGQRVALGNRGQYEFAVFVTTADSNDPDGLAAVTDGELSPVYSRSAGLATPELHKLFAEGRAEYDTAKRRAIYARVEQVFLQQAPYVSLAWRAQAYGMAKSVQGFGTLPGALTGNSGILLEEAWIG